MSTDPYRGMGDALASPASFPFRGSEVLLSPMTLQDFGAIYRRILDQRPKRLNEVMLRTSAWRASGVADDVIRVAIEVAMSEDKRDQPPVTEDEIKLFLSTIEGLAYALWLMSQRSKERAFTYQDWLKELEQYREKPEELFLLVNKFVEQNLPAVPEKKAKATEAAGA